MTSVSSITFYFLIMLSVQNIHAMHVKSDFSKKGLTPKFLNNLADFMGFVFNQKGEIHEEEEYKEINPVFPTEIFEFPTYLRKRRHLNLNKQKQIKQKSALDELMSYLNDIDKLSSHELCSTYVKEKLAELIKEIEDRILEVQEND